MDPSKLRALLRDVASGQASIDGALQVLQELPFQDLDDEVRIDNHRHLRSGIPEVVLGEWKTADQIARILIAMTEHGGGALATRVDADKAGHVLSVVPRATYHERARMVVCPPSEPADAGRESSSPDATARVAVIAAGTSDLAIAEETALTLEFLGKPVERVYDVGVAGVHRLLAEVGKLRTMAVAIVVAGMEGALPSVVAGLLPCAVIAVPTSVGYGASLGGFAALFGMLSSCSPGITVVNIDNGFGAAVAAARMLRAADSTPGE